MRRLRASRAAAEGRGYTAFAEAGIETPQLIAWGELRRWGLWTKGIVITRLIEGPTLAEHLRAGGSADSLMRAAECMATIHRAGLAHGDPRLRNFLIDAERIVPFDLCSWGRLTNRSRRDDLVKFLGSTLTILGPETARAAMERYSTAASWRDADPADILRHADAYAQREQVP